MYVKQFQLRFSYSLVESNLCHVHGAQFSWIIDAINLILISMEMSALLSSAYAVKIWIRHCAIAAQWFQSRRSLSLAHNQSHLRRILFFIFSNFHNINAIYNFNYKFYNKTVYPERDPKLRNALASKHMFSLCGMLCLHNFNGIRVYDVHPVYPPSFFRLFFPFHSIQSVVVIH